MKHNILLSFFLFLSLYSFAQGEKKDSLLELHYSGLANDSTYNNLIWSYVFNQPDSAIFFGNRGLNWGDLNNQKRLFASMHNRIGVAYDIKSMVDSALFHYYIARDLATATQNFKTLAGALNNIGLIYWNKGELEKAIDYYIRSAKIFEATGNKKGLSNNYNNIGLIHYDNNELDRCLEYYHRSLTIRKEIGFNYGIAASYLNLAHLYTTVEYENLDSAIYFNELAISIKKELNDQFGLARAYHNLADAYLQQEKSDTALFYFQKALTIQLQLDNAEGYASTYYNISSVYTEIGNTEKEMAYLDSAEFVAIQHKDNALLWKIYLAKAKVYGKVKEYKKANDYWALYGPLKHSVLNAERSKQVAEIDAKYQTVVKDKKIEEQRTLITKGKLKVANRNKWIAVIVAAGGIITLLILLYFQRNKTKLRAEKDAALISARDAGLKAVIDATENERQRIAKDLHDGVVQSLTGVRLGMAGQTRKLKKSDEASSKKLEGLTADLDGTIGELREISHQMMPRALNEMGLIPALNDMLEKSLGRTDIEFGFEHHNINDSRFDPRIEVSIYRICQELINNIIKHSGAKAVSVQLLATKSNLVLVVEDNGNGFEYEDVKNRNGIGMMNITTRAQAVNGDVNYQPSPQQGTVATVRVPLALQ